MSNEDKCTLLGGWFSLSVQILLAFVCILTLVFKREFEVPRRPWKVWFLDVLKQGIGSSSDHMVNILISILLMADTGDGDECQWYFLVYTLTSTVGCTTNISLLMYIEGLASRNRNSCTAEILNFGEYGDPPKLKRWFIQLSVWMAIVFISKMVLSNLLVSLLFPYKPNNHSLCLFASGCFANLILVWFLSQYRNRCYFYII